MTEDKTVGDSPTVEPTGDPQEDTGTPAKKPYDGKTPEELQTILDEKEKMIGKQAQEVGDLRAKASELENKLSFQSQFGNQPTQEEPNPFDTQFGSVTEPEKGTQETVPPDFWNNPKQLINKWADERDSKRLEEASKRDTEIRMNIYKAKPVIEQAKKETPHLFQNLSNQELELALYNGLANKLVSPLALGDTKTYKQAAMWIQGEKSQYNFNPTSAGSPVPSTETGSYVGDKPPAEEEGAPIALDTLGTEFVKHRPKGMTEDEFMKKVRETQKGGK